MTGSRKSQQNTRTQDLLLAGFCVASLLDVPAELFWTLAAGLGVNQASFVWGNSQEWKARGQTDAKPTPTPPKV